MSQRRIHTSSRCGEHRATPGVASAARPRAPLGLGPRRGAPPRRLRPTASRLAAAWLLGLALLGCDAAGEPLLEADTDAAAQAAPSRTEPIAVSVAPLVRAPMASIYSTSGTLRADKRATVTSRTRGVVEQLFVEEGDAVAAGQPMAQLENREQLLAVKRFETIHEIKARELERSRSLLEDELVSTVEFEATRQQLQEIESDLDLARLNLARTTIDAPFDGVVVRRYLDVGGTVNDGTAIVDLADLDPLFVDVSVPERHVARLAPGQTVQLRADAAALSIEAQIERLAPVVDAATGTVKVTVAVDPGVALRPGAFVQLDVVTDVRPEALVIPRSALVAEGRRWLVYRLTDSGDSVEALEVTLGYEQGLRVELAGVVGADRLAAGDRLVVRGASALSDGAPVQIVPDAVNTPGEPGDALGTG